MNVVDIEGQEIKEGSVLYNTEDFDRGVVKHVWKEGDLAHCFQQVGDISIVKAKGLERVTNQYGKWKHIQKKEQTYLERFLAWLYTPCDFDQSDVKDFESMAIEGVLNLLPEDIYDDSFYEDASFENALNCLAIHLDELKCKLNDYVLPYEFKSIGEPYFVKNSKVIPTINPVDMKNPNEFDKWIGKRIIIDECEYILHGVERFAIGGIYSKGRPIGLVV